jgi:hypothetical protein
MSQRQSGYPRQLNETYETPSWVVQVVARYLRRYCLIWAPADEESSRLVRTLRGEDFHVFATADDFLARNSLPYPGVYAIVTNPPFGKGGKLACQFIAHALELKVPVVAMLLRIDFDSGKTRTNLFRDCQAFAHKIVLLDRIVWFPREGKPGPSENHAWFIWNSSIADRRRSVMQGSLIAKIQSLGKGIIQRSRDGNGRAQSNKVQVPAFPGSNSYSFR